MRLFPELFARHRVAPVENYPDELLATLRSVAPRSARRDPDRRAADARHLQLGLLRALVPGRQARRRAGRGPRPLRARTTSSTCARPRARARRRDLPPHRRRLPRSPRLPPGFRARRAGPDDAPIRPATSRWPMRSAPASPTTRRSTATCRRSSVLSRRGADPEERADLALPRAGGISPMCSTISHELVVKEVNGSGGYGMLVGPHADQGDDRGVPRASSSRDPDGFIAQPTLALSTCPTFVDAGRRAAPCRPAALRAHRRRQRPHRAGRPDPRRAEGRLAGGQFQPGRRHQGYLGARR